MNSITFHHWLLITMHVHPRMLFIADLVQAELHLKEASISAKAPQRAAKANLSVTHSRCSCCCVLWVEMKEIGSHKWMSRFQWEADGCHCPSYCLSASGEVANCAQWKLAFYFWELAGGLVGPGSWHTLPPHRSAPEAHFLSLDFISVFHSCPFSYPYSSVSIPLLYATAALTYVVKAILVCVCVCILKHPSVRWASRVRVKIA